MWIQTANSLAGNTSGALAAISSGTMFLAGGNNVTLSQNGQSVTISGAGGGGTISGFWINPDIAAVSAVNLFNGSSTSPIHFGPFFPPCALSISAARLLVNATFNTGANTSVTSGSFSLSVGLYSLNGSTLSLIASGSKQLTLSNSSDANTSLYMGNHFFDVPINTLIPQNQQLYYAVGGNYSIGAGAAMSWRLGASGISTNVGSYGASVTNGQPFPFEGMYSVTSGGIPATAVSSDIAYFSSVANIGSASRFKIGLLNSY